MEITLGSLVESVERTSDDPLLQLDEAVTLGRHLSNIGDSLIDHFVSACRGDGRTWSDISARLGVSRQAVQQRFTAPSPPRVASPPGKAKGTSEHHGKYRPLWLWLREQSGAAVNASFTQIEQVLGFALPPSSRNHHPHWHSYDGSAVARAVIDAGWKAQNVDLDAETVRFVRVYSGKVRDIHAVGDDKFLLLASDRLSVFDVVLNEMVPDKGRVLTGMTHYWLTELADVAPSHMITCDPAEIAAAGVDLAPGDAGRAMLVKRAEMLSVECIVRGYITGSAWSEYKQHGAMHGTRLPAGIQESDKLPEPVFTPSTKADAGDHDVNITFDEAANIIGQDNAERARELSLTAYIRASEQAAARGIIIADTKFELGWIDGELALCDEVLTPDSSRFWPVDEWRPGTTPPSFDKQPVRDLLAATGWNKQPPPPPVSDDVIQETRARYIKAYELITGLSFDDWYGA